jgi:hypothetical protein
MKIEFNKARYKTLVKALFLASWVVNSHKTEEPDDEFERLEQYVLSYGKFFDLKNVDFEETNGKYYHDMDFEQKTLKHLDTFVEESFWDELIERLADRDFFRAYGDAKIRKMSRDERFTKYHELAVPYEEEFSLHGLDNLVIHSSEQ